MHRVVHIITRFVKGGADFNTLHTLEGISKDYVCYLMTGRTYDEELIEKVKKFNVEVFHTSLTHYNPITAIIAFFQMVFLLKKTRPQIVHTHSTEAGIVGRWAAWLAGVSIIIHTNHGVSFNRNFFAKKFLVFLEKITAKITTKIISNANIITWQFLKQKIGKQEQYLTIYSGIDFDEVKKAKPAAEILKIKKIKVLCASRLVRGKGLEEFIEAAKTIKKESEEFEFFLAGEGELRNELEKKSKGSVAFLGHRADLLSVMKACDLFVLPSHREGTPRVITEALACGIPVIATNIDGIPEQVTEGVTGFLFNPGDFGKLKKLILEKKWKNLKPSISKEFDKKIMVEKIGKLYLECLKS
ncbi:glycosyltransferase [Candidatus Woesearchaeota archaeon]|nr:glycosyltransferase [Candidatus Woesearchaeota archaeon]